MSFWERLCPVCGDPLPGRGNRRLYVPGKKGLKLVHAGACAETVEAQLVFEPPSRKPISPVLLVKARRLVERLLEDDKPTEHTRENLLAIALRARAALLDQELGPEERSERIQYTPEQLRQFVDRVFRHDSEVSAPARTELPT